jgi:hypothetical protein
LWQLFEDFLLRMDLFISPAPELSGRASIKILEEVVTLHDATTFFLIFMSVLMKNSAARKNFGSF